jgi:hypothetical protein
MIHPKHKSAIWTIWNILFGLMPIIAMMMLEILVPSDSSFDVAERELIHLYRDLVIMFFCCAIIGALAIDILFLKSRRFNMIYFSGPDGSTIKILFVSAAFVPLLAAMIIYLPLLFTDFKGVNMRRIVWIQYITLLITCIYSYYVKVKVYKYD